MTQLDAQLFRQHGTLTYTKKFQDQTFELPLRQEVLVRFDADASLFTAETDTVVASAVQALSPANESTDGWLPWTVRMLREAHDFEIPPPVRVAAGSPAGRLLAATLARYPSLYGDDAFTPYRVFEHWFCTNGNGLEWHQGRLRYRGTDALPHPLSAEDHASDLAGFIRWQQTNWSRQLLANPPVRLYPLAAGYSLLFQVPEDVEDSFLVAALHLCEYLLRRPAWENHGYSPAELTGSDRSPGAAVWRTEDWRHIALADGMQYRTLVNQAYARLVLGSWRPRMRALGFEDKGFRVDYSLPPRARRFSRV